MMRIKAAPLNLSISSLRSLTGVPHRPSPQHRTQLNCQSVHGQSQSDDLFSTTSEG